MLVSTKGNQQIAELVRAGEGAKLKELVEQKDARGLEAKGLSRLDALALLQAAETGSSAVFALSDAGKSVRGQGDGTAGSAQAVLKSVNQAPARNSPTLQRMQLMTETKTERTLKTATEALGKLNAQLSPDLSFGLAEASMKLPVAQLDQAVARLHALAGDKAALSRALGEAGWDMKPRFDAPKTGKTTYFDGPSAFRVRQEHAPSLVPSLKPGVSGTAPGGVRPRIEAGIQLKGPSVDLKDLLAGLAQQAPVLRPSVEVETTLVSFELQHADGRSTIIDLERLETTRSDGTRVQAGVLELAGSKAEISSWPALLQALGVRGEPPGATSPRALSAS